MSKLPTIDFGTGRVPGTQAQRDKALDIYQNYPHLSLSETDTLRRIFGDDMAFPADLAVLANMTKK